MGILKKDENEVMTRDKAEGLLRKWADALELDTRRELFNDLLDELTGVVEKERLSFDESTEIFTYNLLKPVNGKSFVTIQETTFEQKKSLQRYSDKEGMDASAMMIGKHTNLTFKEVMMLKSRDLNKINAVVIGFLTQVATK